MAFIDSRLVVLAPLAALLLLVACAAPAETGMDDTMHGAAPTASPNLPEATGGLNVTSSMVAYYDGVQGYLARPVGDGQYPGVIMIHEWWGLNDNIKAMADRLAAQGYIVLAVDLYNGNVATTPDEARSFMGAFDQEEGIRNMRAAAAYLRAQGAPKLASLGWCFGGGQSLQLALSEDLDATVIYYGQLVTDERRLAAIEQPVLGVFAGEDASIPVSSVQQFDAALDDLGVRNEIVVYPGVGHAFANPSGDSYAPREAQDAWEKTVTFLAQNLRG
jgi:carboxymethylenebutenolidase